MIDTILYILALVFFLLAGFGVPRANWQWLACGCIVAALWLL